MKTNMLILTLAVTMGGCTVTPSAYSYPPYESQNYPNEGNAPRLGGYPYPGGDGTGPFPRLPGNDPPTLPGGRYPYPGQNGPFGGQQIPGGFPTAGGYPGFPGNGPPALPGGRYPYPGQNGPFGGQQIPGGVPTGGYPGNGSFPTAGGYPGFPGDQPQELPGQGGEQLGPFGYQKPN
jgi:hypothetical protein